MVLTSRQEALSSGAKIYFTGQPCTQGHVSEMHVREGCLECKRLRSIAYRASNLEFLKQCDAEYRSANRESVRAKDKAHYHANKDRMRVKSAVWRQANPKRQRELTIAWREANRERVRASMQIWFSKHPEAQRIYKQNRRAREMQGDGRLSEGIVEKLFVLQRGLCACCRKKLGDDFHLDHIVPLAKGGEHSDSNMQLLTPRCNTEKHAKDPIEFMQLRGFLL